LGNSQCSPLRVTGHAQYASYVALILVAQTPVLQFNFVHGSKTIYNYQFDNNLFIYLHKVNHQIVIHYYICIMQHQHYLGRHHEDHNFYQHTDLNKDHFMKLNYF